MKDKLSIGVAEYGPAPACPMIDANWVILPLRSEIEARAKTVALTMEKRRGARRQNKNMKYQAKSAAQLNQPAVVC
ncbi:MULTISPECIES: hypothetical protein [unclassified Rhizobium]|uniref:hypothetical protein n=1 Tax=unclassified Rhizobium TaxID=2613769 RepID=UPI0013C4D7DB|nr:MULTISPECIES: hypothetical protein [unclassified Rhizobium]